MVTEWVVSQLEPFKDASRIIVQDPLQLLPKSGGAAVDAFRRDNGFAVIVAWTNLALRDLYRQFQDDPTVDKLLLIDRTPYSRLIPSGVHKAPPPFYPDILAQTPENGCMLLSLRRFLMAQTKDSTWPESVDEPRFARLIAPNLGGVLRAYENLRSIDKSRFTDADLTTIIGYAALGVPEAAFKRLTPEQCWQIGLLGYRTLDELDELAPAVTKPIRDELRRAQPPFCWFEGRDTETVVRAFYLAVILAQHFEKWDLLLKSLDPSLNDFTMVQQEMVTSTAARLVAHDPQHARLDIERAEASLDKAALTRMLVEQLEITKPERFAAVALKERYSTLNSSIALLLALDNLLSEKPDAKELKPVLSLLFGNGDGEGLQFLSSRGSAAWANVVEATRLAVDVMRLRHRLANAVKTLKVQKPDKLTFAAFRQLWVDEGVCRVEYLLSTLERLTETAELLPLPRPDLPDEIVAVRDRIRSRVANLASEIAGLLDEMNSRFQQLVQLQYPTWIREETAVHLTSQFVRRCLKPYWDPQTEDAVVFVFDGMRYDIWQEFVRPMLEERMNLIADLPAISLLPSETHVTRKAICAGTYPDEFDMGAAEHALLKATLGGEFGYQGSVEVVEPQGAATAEVVRFRAGRLEMRIFELCDRELHKVSVKELADGRWAASRPLEYIYKQQIKNIIDNEVMSAVRDLPPETKVFVTADHGFARVPRERLWFKDSDLNETTDCRYLNCALRVPQDLIDLPADKRKLLVAFTPEQLRYPAHETRTIKATGTTLNKEYRAIVFPQTGYAFSQSGKPFDPDAYSHGGISVQELMIPMVALQVKPKEESLVAVGEIEGPETAIEGEVLEFRLPVRLAATAPEGMEIRVEVDAEYRKEAGDGGLPHRTLYVTAKGAEVTYSFVPAADEAEANERAAGSMHRVLTITLSYDAGGPTCRKSQAFPFSMTLNADQVIRRVSPRLGSLLGLSPKNVGQQST